MPNCIKIHPIVVKIFHAEPQMSDSWWYWMKKGIAKVIRSHPLGTMNVCVELLCEYIEQLLRYFYLELKWLTDQHCHQLSHTLKVSSSTLCKQLFPTRPDVILFLFGVALGVWCIITKGYLLNVLSVPHYLTEAACFIAPSPALSLCASPSFCLVLGGICLINHHQHFVCCV